MAVRLIAMDMDGTLLNSAHAASAYSQEVLRQAAARGIALAYATGRSICELDELRVQMPFIRYAVSENGAVVRDLETGETIHENGLEMKDIREIFHALLPYDPMFELLADGRIYVQQSCLDHMERYDIHGFEEIVRRTRTGVPDMARMLTERTAPVTKVHLFFRNPDVRNEAMAATAHMPYDITHQLHSNLEFNRKGATKGVGVKKLAEKLGIPLADVMALGDNFNDVPMLQVAGVSVAMSNAEPEAKAAARYETCSNDEDGVAKAILKWAL